MVEKTVKWHTVEPLTFFVAQVKTVPVGDLPMALIFKVLRQPNHWERQLKPIAQETQETSPLTKKQLDAEISWFYLTERTSLYLIASIDAFFSETWASDRLDRTVHKKEDFDTLVPPISLGKLQLVDDSPEQRWADSEA